MRADARATPLIAALAALVPVFCDWIYKVFILPRPFWIFYYDPQMLYFYGGLSLTAGRAPYAVDTPGIPVHLLSALLVSITGRSPLLVERFLCAAYVLTLLMLIASAVLLARTLLRGLPIALQAVAIGTYFLCSQAFEYLTVWSPETLYFVCGAIALAALWSELEREYEWRRTFATGAAIGLCVALKFTFLAWVPAYLCALAIRRRRIDVRAYAVAIGGMAAAFLVATIVVAREYPYMLSFLWKISARSGAYGSGSASLPDLDTVVMSAKLWHLWFGAATLLAIAAVWRRGVAQELRALVTFGVVSTLASYAMAIRHMELRYVLTTGLGAIAIFAALFRALPATRLRTTQFAVAAIAILLAAKTVAADLTSHRMRIEKSLATRRAIADALAPLVQRDGVIIYGWRAPEPSFALRILAYKREHWDVIEQRYPNEGHYNGWYRTIELPRGRTTWDYAVISDDEVAQFPQPATPVAHAGTFTILRPQARASRPAPRESAP
jgi:hypothetical protein